MFGLTAFTWYDVNITYVHTWMIDPAEWRSYKKQKPHKHIHLRCIHVWGQRLTSSSEPNWFSKMKTDEKGEWNQTSNENWVSVNVNSNGLTEKNPETKK